MPESERRDGPTPAGGTYSTIDYLRGDAWQPVDKADADRAIIREYNERGEMIEETIGVITVEEGSTQGSRSG